MKSGLLKSALSVMTCVIVLSLPTCELVPGYHGKDVDTELVALRYLEYTDYYSGYCLALKYDITNKSTTKTIVRMPWEVDLTYKTLYTDELKNRTFYPDIVADFPPNTTTYSY